MQLASTIDKLGDKTMKKSSPAIAFCSLMFAAKLTSAQGFLVGSIPFGGGPITIRNEGFEAIESVGLDVVSSDGFLTGGEDPAPWGTSLVHTPNAITFITFPGSTTLEAGGSWTLSARYNGCPGRDLAASYSIQIQGSLTSVAFPTSSLAAPHIAADPMNGSTIDFGMVARGDASAYNLTDAIQIADCDVGKELTHFEFTGASVFDVPDFEPVILSRDQPPVTFDLALDVGAEPGHYEAELSFIFDVPFFGDVPITYTVTAQVVPEPHTGVMLFAGLSLLGRWRRSTRG